MDYVSIEIPATSNPYEVWVNGVKYTYEAGKTAEVPNEVAIVIKQHIKVLEEGLLPPENGPSSGGVSSWNDLPDRPFGETPTGGDTLTWDGNTEGRYTIDAGVLLVHVSDSTPKMTELEGAKISFGDGNDTVEYPVLSTQLSAMADVAYVHTLTNMLVVFADGTDLGGVVAEKAGIYFPATYQGLTLTKFSLTIPGYTGFPVTKQIDPKYIPPLTQAQLPKGYPWDGRTVIEWDGNTEGMETDRSGAYVRVAETAPPASEWNGGKINVMGEEVSIGSTIPFVEADGYCYVGSEEELFVVGVCGENVTVGGILFTDPGVYVLAENGAMSVTFGRIEKMSADFVPLNVLYWKNDNYLYVDSSFTTKATKNDVMFASRKGAVFLDLYAQINLPGFYIEPCVGFDFVSHDWAVVYFVSGSNTGTNTEDTPVFVGAKTAEYTG